MANVFYNRIIRKLVVGFGNLFNEITMVRYNPDSTEAERFIVPIAYASKEHYVQRLEADYNLDKKVQMTLPRLSFEMTGMRYDSSRKQNTNIKNFNQTSGGAVGQYNPVPYDVEFSLYLYVRNIEDGTQVIEHIIPYFTPDYTIKLNMIPEMGIIKEVPIILNNVTQDIQYEGDRSSDPRLIIWTLNFTAKANFYGPVSTTGLIKTSITNILNDITDADVAIFNMTNPGIGNYQVGEYVYQGHSLSTSTATAKVVLWSNGALHLTEINGNFVTGRPVYGGTTNANYTFSTYNILGPVLEKYAQITIVPNPTTANANSNYTYTTTVEETGGVTVITGNANNEIINAPAAPAYNFNDLDLMNNTF